MKKKKKQNLKLYPRERGKLEKSVSKRKRCKYYHRMVKKTDREGKKNTSKTKQSFFLLFFIIEEENVTSTYATTSKTHGSVVGAAATIAGKRLGGTAR